MEEAADHVMTVTDVAESVDIGGLECELRGRREALRLATEKLQELQARALDPHCCCLPSLLIADCFSTCAPTIHVAACTKPVTLLSSCVESSTSIEPLS